MTAYYNENDPYAAQWLKNLISAGLIPAGHVDARSIVDVRATDLAGYTQHHFFAGIAGWCRALRLAEWPDDRPIWTGSCPCQPFSEAGKRKGFDDDRHLWPEWFRLINECKPAIIFGEQVASAPQWLARVRSDLETVGYAVGAIPIEAACAGAPQLRDRYWFVARSLSSAIGGVGDRRPEEPQRQTQGRITVGRPVERDGGNYQHRWIRCSDGRARRIEPGIYLLANDVPARVGKLRAFGNAVVPDVAAEFIGAYMDCENDGNNG